MGGVFTHSPTLFEVICMLRKELLNAIDCVLPGIDLNSESIDGSELITFDDDYVRSLNNNVSASFPMETHIEASVNANCLIKILSKLDYDKVDIDLIGDKLIIRCKNSTLKLQILDRVSFSKFLPIPKDNLFIKLPDKFVDCLKLAIFSTSKKTNDGVLTGVYLDKSQMISSDDYRISVIDIDFSNLNADYLIIPNKVVCDILKTKDLVYFCYLKPWLYLKSKSGLIISFLLIEGDYPAVKIREIVGNMDDSIKYSFPKGLSEVVDRAEILSWEDEDLSNVIKLFRKGKNLIVSGKRDVGEYIERIEWVVNEDEFSEDTIIVINPSFLREILTKTNSFYLRKNSIIFSGDGFVHIVMSKVLV